MLIFFMYRASIPGEVLKDLYTNVLKLKFIFTFLNSLGLISDFPLTETYSNSTHYTA